MGLKKIVCGGSKNNNIEDLINANSSVAFDARVEEIMAKIYEQDCWVPEEYEMIRMFIYTKLAPRDWSKKDNRVPDPGKTIDDLESI